MLASIGVDALFETIAWTLAATSGCLAIYFYARMQQAEQAQRELAHKLVPALDKLTELLIAAARQRRRHRSAGENHGL